MLIIEAQRMAQNVANLLVERETWRVHSVFTNGFNLENKDERIFIGTAKNGQLPFAIQLTKSDTNKLTAAIQVNQTIQYEGGILFHQQFQLTLTGATQYTSKREKTEIHPNPSFLTHIVQSERQTGLDVSIQEWLTQPKASNLAKAINSADSTFIEQTLRYFIGRGNGLTPSGDDILLGILLVGQESTTFKEVLSKLIQTELLTTDISQTYLKYALQDQFSDTLLALYEAFQTGAETKDIIERVYQNGHTSGIDTIAGVALAIKEEFSMGKRVVIALGGNAILQPNQEATFENQLKNVEDSCAKIAEITEAGHKVIVTHGNGPQVGNILRQNEEAKEYVPALPIDACSAESQGFIGYMMEQSLKNELARKKLPTNVITLLTQTEVSASDPAFQSPTKPIGVFYTREEAVELSAEKGWEMAEDAGRGYRRVVPSPQPQKIHGVEAIKQLVATDTVVISTGGGGIPVVQNEEGDLKGVEAVIDKDRSALRLSEQVEADVFMILTDVTNVYLHFGEPNQQKLEGVPVKEAKEYMTEGHFADGSMGPKMEAAIAFAESGKEAIICSLDAAVEALAGRAGTRILPEKSTVNA
ncbi:carbamate kinase [Listeria sp. W9-0585]|uniref:Carbamate kinase n=2 Tax=Listeria rustica TaxID=2713503 RepID=A0A7W1T5Z6_9LIST|nr:carbamate kinase [Listeria rustica]